MRTYALSHLSDAVLLRELNTLVAQERGVTAALLAHIAEVDVRRLYVPAGFPSMYHYCVGELHLSEQAAMKRIRAGRAARRFPAVFDAVAEGRLHLSAVVLLAPCLTPDNAVELLAAAAHRTKAEIELMLAQRFPKPDLPTRFEAIAPPPLPNSATAPLSPGTVEAPTLSAPPPLGQVQSPIRHPRVAPLAPERFAIQFTIGKDTYDKLRYVQELLSHGLPSGDIAQVFDRALDALKSQLEKRKFAATAKPRPSTRRSGANSRLVPAHVKRAVWQRDQGQCTFIGETGHRCSSRKFLEFDHRDPVARGGVATVANMRLRCAAHNQLEADRTFGAGFMTEKREMGRCSTATPGGRRDAAP